MNTVIFPLMPQARGPRVVDLQDALQQCLDRNALLANDADARRDLQNGLQRERTDQKYGDFTAKAVSRFQEERRLPSTGEVDEPTATALNALLGEWGLLDTSANAGSKLVSGAAKTEDGALVPGLPVRAAHQTGQVPIRLGEDTTDTDGRYTIRYEALADGPVNLIVSALGDDRRILVTSQVVPGARSIEIVDLTIPEIEIKPNWSRVRSPAARARASAICK